MSMTNAMTVRPDEDTSRELAELAGHYPSRSAAIQDAIHSAWRRLQADKLEAGYAAAVADNPHYPYESAEEAAVLRSRRRSPQQRDTLRGASVRSADRRIAAILDMASSRGWWCPTTPATACSPT